MRTGKTAAVGALAAGAAGFAAGAVVERRAVRRQVRPLEPGPALPMLTGTREAAVTCDDGVRLAAYETGPDDAALTLVFAHGYTCTSDCWAAQVRDLSGEARPGGLRIVLYDQRGHGGSQPGDAVSHTIEQLGSDLAEVLSQRVPDGPVVLVGHSMGGMTIMALAQQHPELFGSKVVAVALVGTSSGGMTQVSLGLPAAFATIPGKVMPLAAKAAPINRRAERFRAVDSDFVRLMNRFVAFRPDASGAELELMSKMQAPMSLETMASFMPTFALHDRTGFLEPLKNVPTLILVGDRDVLTPPTHSRVIADALPDATFVEVPGSGHMVMMEAPEAVTAELRTLLQRVP